MRGMRFGGLCALVLAVAPAFALELPVTTTTPAATPEVDDEAAQERAIEKAQELVAAGRREDALTVLDKMLAYYAARYPEGDTRWYVARDLQDTILYMAMATTEPREKDGPKQAEALAVQWANALFLKGYILVELKRLDEAEKALDQAVELSPYNAMYLIEFAEVAKLRRDWATALARYRRAEVAAEFSADSEEKRDRTHALRGQAFVHIEQGEFDAAEKILKACLKIDPDDARAKEELEYIEKLRKP